MNVPTPRHTPSAGGPAAAIAGVIPAAEFDGSTRPETGTCQGRGVLEGAFALLEALAEAENGLGLTALARSSGLAKTSAYRLAEQLVELGAVQRAEHRYYVGPRLGRIGQHWQPDPQLRQAAQGPVHDLAVKARCDMTALVILDGDRMRVVSATARRGCTYCPDALDPASTARTAAGRVLYATRGGDAALPDCWTPREWRQLREQIAEQHATVVDLGDAIAGICSLSAPVWHPNGSCAGAVFAMVYATSVPSNLPIFVLSAARQIGTALR